VRKKRVLRGLSQLHRCPWVGRWWLSIPAALQRLLAPKNRRVASRTLAIIAQQLLLAVFYAPDQAMAPPCAATPPLPSLFAPA
jgi:hypothetical protein